MVIAARSQSRYLGNDLSASAGRQRSGGQLHARYRTTSLPLGSARERSWQVYRSIRRTHGRSLPASSQWPNAFSVPPALCGRAKVMLGENLHGSSTGSSTYAQISLRYLPHLISLKETR